MTSLIILYTELLHRHRDPEAEPVKQFVAQHTDDPVFLQRVETLNRVWTLKQQSR